MLGTPPVGSDSTATLGAFLREHCVILADEQPQPSGRPVLVPTQPQARQPSVGGSRILGLCRWRKRRTCANMASPIGVLDDSRRSQILRSHAERRSKRPRVVPTGDHSAGLPPLHRALAGGWCPELPQQCGKLVLTEAKPDAGMPEFQRGWRIHVRHCKHDVARMSPSLSSHSNCRHRYGHRIALPVSTEGAGHAVSRPPRAPPATTEEQR